MDELITAIKTLRARLSESQQVFANRLGVSMRAVANYEAGRKPTRAVLFSLVALASRTNHADLAEVFRAAYGDTMRGLTKPTNDEELAWVRMILTLLRNKDLVTGLEEIGTALLAKLERLASPKANGKAADQEIEEAVLWARRQIVPNAEQQLRHLARDRSQRTGEPFATAFTKALLENPDLYREYQKTVQLEAGTEVRMTGAPKQKGGSTPRKTKKARK